MPVKQKSTQAIGQNQIQLETPRPRYPGPQPAPLPATPVGPGRRRQEADRRAFVQANNGCARLPALLAQGRPAELGGVTAACSPTPTSPRRHKQTQKGLASTSQPFLHHDQFTRRLHLTSTQRLNFNYLLMSTEHGKHSFSKSTPELTERHTPKHR